ncbi:hypothetical protein TPHA_0B03100 [Tetrapisispora phaffii CBS 4417]|uniref:Altered inheritance of mitochondria protein 23, mitochondrial n=1 Tax=Tetrapisispora phaffii (strain ATCC 24235 / CBS 4417 / NBRC 1672 / NRRL Y-8282 / UCD 70-5) TaxID=1071381 RepID=G8BPQ1_TETPH|nr:hypothetical protein TPHA_0B03100 [Tetrapisispora phaffii CBS 4417]CCE61982.1 hypothetical protein TPHA_0B03100 [Tetrapisispora phaffii CBS 4417]
MLALKDKVSYSSASSLMSCIRHFSHSRCILYELNFDKTSTALNSSIKVNSEKIKGETKSNEDGKSIKFSLADLYNKTQKSNVRSSNYSNSYKSRSFKSNPIILQKKSSNLPNWINGTEKAKLAATLTYKEILKHNKFGKIKTINPTTGKLTDSKIQDIIRNIDLDKNGIQIVNFEKNMDESITPIVKIIESKIALEKYSQDLAKIKNQELVESGSSANKFKGKKPNEKSAKSIKYIRITWRIENDDLRRQKAHEIQTALKRGMKVHIFIDDNYNASNNWITDFELHLNDSDHKLTKSENTKRESLVKTLEQIFQSDSISPIIAGSIKSKMLIKLSPIQEKTESKGDSNKDNKAKDLKTQKKLLRQQKLEERTKRKQERLKRNML